MSKSPIIVFQKLGKQMGDRFYTQQLASTGSCPGGPITIKRKKRMPWEQEKKDAVIAGYLERNPTPETSVEIVKDLADEYDESPNGVRMVLSKAEVYVKKSAAAPAAGGKAAGGGGGRVSKAAAQEALIAALESAGAEVDEEIIGKLTGKAAQYFTTVLTPAN